MISAKPEIQDSLEDSLIRICFSALSLASFIYVWLANARYVSGNLALMTGFAAATLTFSLVIIMAVWLLVGLIDGHFSRRGLIRCLYNDTSIFVPLTILVGYPLLVLPQLEDMLVILPAFLIINAAMILVMIAFLPRLRDHIAGLWMIMTSYIVFMFRGRNLWWTVAVWTGSLSVGLFLWSQTYPQSWRPFILHNQIDSVAYAAMLRFLIFYIIAGHIAWVLMGYLKKKAIKCASERCFASIAQSYLPLAPVLLVNVIFSGKPGGYQLPILIFSLLAAAAGGLAAYKVAPRILKSTAVGEKLTLIMVLSNALLIYVVLLSIVSLRKFSELAIDAEHLGIIEQLLWNTAHGRLFSSSAVAGLTLSLGDHLSFIWLLIAPIYAIHSSPEFLLILQPILIGLGAIPLFMIASKLFNSRWTALIIAGAYLLFFPLQNSAISGVSELSMTPVLFFSAFYAWMKDRTGWMILWLALLLGVNEELALTVAAFGLFSMLFSEKKLLGFYISVAGVAYFLVAIKIIIPHFRGAPYPYDLLPPYLGVDMIHKVITFAFNPIFIIKSFVTPLVPKLHAFLQIFGPLSLLPLFGGSTLMIMLPAAAMKWFSSDPAHWGASLQYTAHISPLLMISACYGIHNLSEWRNSYLLHRHNLWSSDKEQVVFAMAWTMLISSFLTCFYFGSTPISQSFESQGRFDLTTDRGQILKAIASRVPPTASVSAQTNIFSHLAQREDIRLFPDIRNSTYIVLDLNGDTAPLNADEYRQQLVDLLESGDYELVIYHKDLVMLRTGSASSSNQKLLRELK